MAMPLSWHLDTSANSSPNPEICAISKGISTRRLSRRIHDSMKNTFWNEQSAEAKRVSLTS